MTIENVSEAWDSAHIENNMRCARGIMSAIATEWYGQISVIDNMLTGMDAIAIERLDNQRSNIVSRLKERDEREEQIAAFIDKYRLTTPIDRPFVEAAFYACGQVEDARRVDPQAADALERELFDNFNQALLARRADEAKELEAQTKVRLPLSQDRYIDLTASSDTNKLSVRIPMIVDPREVPVRIGPEAVTTVFGGPLSDEDYKAIAHTVMEMPGTVGEASRKYAEAQLAEAEAKAKGYVPMELRSNTELALAELHNLFHLFKDPDSFGPVNWIVRNALFVHAIRQVPALDDHPSPQPFTD